MMPNEQALTAPAPTVDEKSDAEQYSLVVSCRSVCGRRDVNQDVAAVLRFRAQEAGDLFVGMVADGMGGFQGGGVAAAQSVQAFITCLHSSVLMKLHNDVAWGLACVMKRAFEFANQWVIHYAQSIPGYHGMGTTLTVAAVEGNTLYVGSIGDSRAYRWRQGNLEQLTRDDSFVQILVDQGLLSRQEADDHPRANELTRALGSPEDTQDLNITCHEVESGDLVILCSDGFWKFSNPLFKNACQAFTDEPVTQARLDRFTADLVDEALRAGSDDNISLVVLGWNRPEESSAMDVTSRNQEEIQSWPVKNVATAAPRRA